MKRINGLDPIAIAQLFKYSLLWIMLKPMAGKKSLFEISLKNVA